MGHFCQSEKTLPTFSNPGGARRQGLASRLRLFGTEDGGLFQFARFAILFFPQGGFGSTLAARRPLVVCVLGIRRVSGFNGVMVLHGCPFLVFVGSMLSFFPPKCAQIDGTGRVRKRLAR